MLSDTWVESGDSVTTTRDDVRTKAFVAAGERRPRHHTAADVVTVPPDSPDLRLTVNVAVVIIQRVGHQGARRFL